MNIKVQIIENFSAIMLGIYIAGVFWVTVVGRNGIVENSFYFSPFHSFQTMFSEIKNHGIMGNFWGNIILFCPIGFIATFVMRSVTIKHITLLGFGISAFIEISQIIFSKGYFEVDDLVTNTFGVFLGAIIGKSLKRKVL